MEKQCLQELLFPLDTLSLVGELINDLSGRGLELLRGGPLSVHSHGMVAHLPGLFVGLPLRSVLALHSLWTGVGSTPWEIPTTPDKRLMT